MFIGFLNIIEQTNWDSDNYFAMVDLYIDFFTVGFRQFQTSEKEGN